MSCEKSNCQQEPSPNLNVRARLKLLETEYLEHVNVELLGRACLRILTYAMDFWEAQCLINLIPQLLPDNQSARPFVRGHSLDFRGQPRRWETIEC